MQTNKQHDDYWAITAHGNQIKLASQTFRAALREAWQGASVWLVTYNENHQPFVAAYRRADAKRQASKWIVCAPFMLLPGHLPCCTSIAPCGAGCK